TSSRSARAEEPQFRGGLLSVLRGKWRRNSAIPLLNAARGLTPPRERRFAGNAVVGTRRGGLKPGRLRGFTQLSRRSGKAARYAKALSRSAPARPAGTGASGAWSLVVGALVRVIGWPRPLSSFGRSPTAMRSWRRRRSRAQFALHFAGQIGHTAGGLVIQFRGAVVGINAAFNRCLRDRPQHRCGERHH